MCLLHSCNRTESHTANFQKQDAKAKLIPLSRSGISYDFDIRLLTINRTNGEDRSPRRRRRRRSGFCPSSLVAVLVSSFLILDCYGFIASVSSCNRRSSSNIIKPSTVQIPNDGCCLSTKGSDAMNMRSSVELQATETESHTEVAYTPGLALMPNDFMVMAELSEKNRVIRSSHNDESTGRDERKSNDKTGNSRLQTDDDEECNEEDETDTNDSNTPNKDVIAKRAALLRKRAVTGSRAATGKDQRKAVSEAKQKQVEKRQSTSVGFRRTGSASSKRQGGSLTGSIMDAIRKTASAGTTPNEEPKNSSNSEDNDKPKPTGAENKASSLPVSAQTTASIIHATVSDIIEKQMKRMERSNRQEKWASPQLPRQRKFRSMGVLGEVSEFVSWERELPNNMIKSLIPKPGTILVPPSSVYEQNGKYPKSPLTVRVAIPMDDVDIANLRLSVFSDFSPELRRQFCSRSCQAIRNRRLQGATCVVATLPHKTSTKGTRSESIVGSAECSFHEFYDTELGRRREPNSILYVTEVAVNPLIRRKGVGSKLMESIDKLASIRNVETIYLHVDVTNDAAIALYEKAGYRRIMSNDHPMFSEFTKSLNLHDGATKGRNHYLLFKDLSSFNPKWFEKFATTSNNENFVFTTSLSKNSEELPSSWIHDNHRGSLGFDVSDVR